MEQIVTCRTTECENEGVPITVTLQPGDGIVCGPCGTEITEVTDGVI